MGGCWIKYQLFKQELAQRTKAAGRQGTNTGKCSSPPTRDWETVLLSLPQALWLVFLGLQPQMAIASHRALPMARDQAQPSPAQPRPAPPSPAESLIRREVCSKQMILFTISHSDPASFEHPKGFLKVYWTTRSSEGRSGETRKWWVLPYAISAMRSYLPSSCCSNRW